MKSENSYEEIQESSYEKINYFLRPAKQIERKLIIEALQCLRTKFPIQDYQYIGMGSLFYVDYYMFHKFLGIKHMISMEKDEDKVNRFEFNRPYRFIRLIPDTSTNILPTLKWKDKNMFIWLDYDSKLSRSMIDDIQIVCNYIKTGGILLVTVDAEPKRFSTSTNAKDIGDSLKQLSENFKEQLHPYYPPDITLKNLSLKYFPMLLRRIILDVIQEKLHTRKLNYYQIFNFKYKDTSQMYTFGCMFGENPNDIENTGLFEFDFVSRDDRLVEITVPILTPLEKLYLDKLIPGIGKKGGKISISTGKLENYEKYYKYYPQYFESLI